MRHVAKARSRTAHRTTTLGGLQATVRCACPGHSSPLCLPTAAHPALYRLHELQNHTEQLERSADGERAAALEARAQLARAESELRVSKASVSSLEQQAQALRQQLQVGGVATGGGRKRAQGVCCALCARECRIGKCAAPLGNNTCCTCGWAHHHLCAGTGCRTCRRAVCGRPAP